MLPTVFLSGLLALPLTGLICVSTGSSVFLSQNDTVIALFMGVFQVGLGLVLYTIESKTIPAAELTLLSLSEVMLAPNLGMDVPGRDCRQIDLAHRGDHLVSLGRDSGCQNQPRSGALNLILVMPHGSCMRCGSACMRFSRLRQSRVSKQTGIRHFHGHFPVPRAKTSPWQLSSKHIVVDGRDLCTNLLGSAPTN